MSFHRLLTHLILLFYWFDAALVANGWIVVAMSYAFLLHLFVGTRNRLKAPMFVILLLLLFPLSMGCCLP